MADQKPEYTSCFTGTLHVGTPRGKIESILDIPTYITHPPNTLKPNGHIILYFPDVWGLSNNASLLMDGFADAGYLVCGIDYFRGVYSPAPAPATPFTVLSPFSPFTFRLSYLSLSLSHQNP